MRRLALVILIILVFMCVFGVYAALKRPLLHIAFLNVSKGDAILITTPSDNRALIDGGPDQSVLFALGREMPFYVRSIDIVLATSQKSSDIGGLPFVFDRFNVGAFVDSGLLSKTTTYKTVLNDVSQKNIPRITANMGDDINLGNGAHFLVLSSGAEITGKIIYGQTSISIPADIPNLASSTDDIVFESDGTNIWRK